MSHIAILGLGNWGTALAKTWMDAKHEISGWTIENEVYESITSKSINEKYQKMLSKLEMRFGALRGTLLGSILEGFGVPLGSLGASLWEKWGSRKGSKK